jgi:tetratricopeptide (TPR) repeat protein
VLGNLRLFLRHSPTARLVLAVILLGVIGYSVFLLGRHLWANAQLQAAQEALDRGQVAQARVYLLRCLRVHPEDPDVLFLLGRAARRAGDYDGAGDYLRRAKQAGGEPERIKLEWLLQDVQRGQAGQAEPMLWAYVDNDHPDAVDILEALARGYLATYRLDEARKAVDALTRLQPEHAPAWVLRGKALYHQHVYPEAEQNYARAVDLAPEDAAARLLLAECLVENKKAAAALEQFDRLRVQTPADPAVVRGQARCLLDLGRDDEARAVLDELLAVVPSDAEALILRGKLEMGRQQPAAAEPWLRKAVKLDPGSLDGAYNLSLCLQQQPGKKDEGAEWFQKYKVIAAEQARMSAVTKQIMRAPHNPAPRCEAGEIMLKVANEKEGLRWVYSALQIDPNYRQAHQLLRDYFRSKGRNDLAEPHERALGKQ